MMRRLTGLLALLVTWGLVFFVLVFLTELVLVPWDTALERPALGTWQRTLNDFFETAPGNMTIALLLVAASGVLLARNQRPAYFRLAGVNLLFVVLLFGLFMAAVMVNNAIFPYSDVPYDPSYPGYYRSVLPGLVVFAVCTVWLWWQSRAGTSNDSGNIP